MMLIAGTLINDKSIRIDTADCRVRFITSEWCRCCVCVEKWFKKWYLALPHTRQCTAGAALFKYNIM